MVKDNERFFYRLHVVIDAFVIAFSYLFACFLQLGFFIEKDIGRLTTEEYLLPLLFVVPGLLLLYYAFNLYTSKRIQGRRLEIGNIVKANSLMLLIFLSVLMLRHMDDFSRQLVFLFYGIDTAGGGGPFSDPPGAGGYPEKGHEPQTDSAGGLQPGGRGVYRPD